MKWIKRILLAGVLLILIAAVVLYVSLNSIVRSEVERQASASLGVTTTLGSAKLSLLGGSISLNDLQISSPPTFSSPQIFALGGTGVTVQYGQLTGSPIHIEKILIDNPVLIVEQANAKLNLKALMDQMPQSPKTSSGQTTQSIKLVIDDLDLNNAEVTFMPGIPGLTNSVQISIPSMSLKNIGNANGNGNGAAIKDVVMQVVTALAAKAADASKLPPEVKLLLGQELNGLSKQLGPGFDGQFQDLAGSLTKQLSPKLENSLEKLIGGKGK
ncbi:MAG: hypothetical protein ABSC42_08105 [Tepidisphaeraceae bacterium]|jgi:uncharacterized protein involved in outer membrane biogenesis